MQRFVLNIFILCVVVFLAVILFEESLTPLFEQFGNPIKVQNSVLFYVMLVGLGALALVFLKTIIGIVIILLLLLLLFILFQMDFIYIVQVVS